MQHKYEQCVFLPVVDIKTNSVYIAATSHWRNVSWQTFLNDVIRSCCLNKVTDEIIFKVNLKVLSASSFLTSDILGVTVTGTVTLNKNHDFSVFKHCTCTARQNIQQISNSINLNADMLHFLSLNHIKEGPLLGLDLVKSRNIKKN